MAVLAFVGTVDDAVRAEQDRWAQPRAAMVSTIQAHAASLPQSVDGHGISPAVLDVMGKVPRHRFVPEGAERQAYADMPLPIGYGQTISQPFIVALMSHLAQGEAGVDGARDWHRVWLPGRGALAAGEDRLHIEIIPGLGETAARRLQDLGYDNVQTKIGDGYFGWPECGPFDGILVTAAAGHVPPPLVKQLKPGGRMVIPVGSVFGPQFLTLVEKTSGGQITSRQILPVPFRAAGARGPMISYLALAVISAAILAYEVLLVRLFAIVQWHHFAFMAISIALLGFGASGTWLALWQRWAGSRFTPIFAASAALFALSAPASFLAAQALPFNALAIVWDPGQLLYLLAMYLLLVVPFFCGATCVGLAFVCYGDKVGRIYAFNLIGSAVGALGIVAVLFVLPPRTLFD